MSYPIHVLRHLVSKRNLTQLAYAIGVNRGTLQRFVNQKGYRLAYAVGHRIIEVIEADLDKRLKEAHPDDRKDIMDAHLADIAEAAEQA